MWRMVLSTLTVAPAALSFALVLASGGKAQQAPPINDNFAQAHEVVLGFSPPGGGYEDIVQTGGATLEQDEPVCVPGGGATVWYLYYPPTTADITIDTAGSDFSTFVSVFRSTGFFPSPPGGSLEQIACAGSPGTQAQVQLNAVTGQGGYAIQVGGLGGETGRLVLNVSCSAGGCPPPNDEIANAGGIFSMPFDAAANTTVATLEESEPRACGNVARTVWYRFQTYEGAGDTINVSASSDAVVPVAAVYEVDLSLSISPLNSLRQVACAYAAGDQSPSAEFVTEPFTTYYLQLGGEAGTGGEIGFSLRCTPDGGASPCFFGAVEGPGTGVGQGGSGPPVGGGGVAPPDTGSGGHRARAR